MLLPTETLSTGHLCSMCLHFLFAIDNPLKQTSHSLSVDISDLITDLCRVTLGLLNCT